MTALPQPFPQRGSCTLVGAGPGDPELLTLKAVKAIAAASVLFVDDLVSDGVMSHAALCTIVTWASGRRRQRRLTFYRKAILPSA